MEAAVQKLCARCRTFDLESIFDPASKLPPSGGRPITPNIEYWPSARAANTCTLCYLLESLREMTEHSVRYGGTSHLRAWCSTNLSGLDRRQIRKAKPSVIISLELGGGSQSWSRVSRNWLGRGFILPAADASLDSSNDFQVKAKIINTDSVDFHALRRWLSHCDNEHGETCRNTRVVSLSTMRVIDCDSMVIVPVASLHQVFRYYALSYVWGTVSHGDTKSISTTDHILLDPHKLPQVARDAIAVVKEMEPPGQRYLWIDRYCILQHDSIDKHLQVRAMDQIYECAYAVIVAAAGNGTDCGLSGVRNTARQDQPTVKLSNMDVVSTLPDVSTALRHTTWRTRGWTYQEAVLSRRCLVFTELQVYFVCETSTYSESMRKMGELPQPRSGVLNTLSPLRDKYMVQYWDQDYIASVAPLAQHVGEYSRRCVSNEEDALDAFRGVLIRAKCRTYWGMPVYTVKDWSIDDVFGGELGWREAYNSSLLQRRSNFPSRSWTRWSGGVELCSIHSNEQHSTSEFRVSIVLPDGNLKRLSDVYESAGDSPLLEELSQNLYIQANMVKVRLNRWSDKRRTEPRRMGENAKRRFFCVRDRQRPCSCKSNMYRISVNLYLNGRSDVTESDHLLWDAVLIPSREFRSRLLVVEWQGKVARRVGLIKSEHHSLASAIEKLPKVCRSIELA
jgi:hypothetical protein